MSDSNQNGGSSNGAASGGSLEIPPEAASLIQMIGMRIHAFVPSLTEEQINGLLAMLIQEEKAINEDLVPNMVDQTTKRPWMYLELKHATLGKGLRLQTLKNLMNMGELDPKKRLEILINHVLIVALMTDGMTARGVLRAFGWTYSVGEMPQEVVEQKIKLV